MAVTERPLAEAPPIDAATKSDERRALAVGCGAHALHDGFTDIIWVVLPLWQAEFALPYAAVGLLRTAFTGTMALLQIPATFLAERVGRGIVLAGGTALSGLCFCLAGASAGFPMLLAALFLGGLGASTQHPIASALVARTFAGPRAITALGTYNFAGDVGKMAVPALATLLLWLDFPWRSTVALLGILGLVAAAAILFVTSRLPRADAASAKAGEKAVGAGGEIPSRRGYWLLVSIAAIDSITRAGFMVFVPFLLIEKGASIATAGFALTLIFIGGASGKLVCAWIGARFGVIGAIAVTEVLTMGGMVAVLALPLAGAIAVLPIVGVVLNGTSSLTYGSVPRFVTAAQRDRAFGVFYTFTLGAGALSPTLSGFAGDVIGLHNAVLVAASLTLGTLPLTWLLRRAMRIAPP